jgi:hypothetical protein
MSLTNEILPFCPTDTGTNLESQAAYLADSDRTSGNKPGVASSNLNNKALRQSTFIASQVGEFLKTTNNMSVLDNNTNAQLLAQMVAALKFFPPVINRITSGSGTQNATYIFCIATGSATAAATYSDGTTTFTVVATISSATVLYCTGGTAPADLFGTYGYCRRRWWWRCNGKRRRGWQ